MRRRDFITALGTAATWPLAARVSDEPELAQEIGEVNFELAYPNGKEDFYAEKAAEGGGFSRGFLKAVRPDEKE
jgi:hypothetical protein